ncbi:hypothetical protein BT96DRAFT_999868 [Gymnopus androsaceus JB14]|uniref:Uncharacterized protein n=1 Tax=Gymnopus androsaceus JB14 TaxID=1447944 RepID=A0A6A4H5C0_9AGAR|nr:hypothetical protein BT96DRAFT_999868 [Gymnopus androsaceus JB14]
MNFPERNRISIQEQVNVENVHYQIYVVIIFGIAVLTRVTLVQNYFPSCPSPNFKRYYVTLRHSLLLDHLIFLVGALPSPLTAPELSPRRPQSYPAFDDLNNFPWTSIALETQRFIFRKLWLGRFVSHSFLGAHNDISYRSIPETSPVPTIPPSNNATHPFASEASAINRRDGFVLRDPLSICPLSLLQNTPTEVPKLIPDAV